MLTLDGSPIRLTALSAGVSFDVDGDGVREPIAWTRAGSTAAFLVLDLDGDGAITTGAELFGVPVGVRRHHRPAAGENSFTLLGAYDTPALGGNGDGVISAADAVFSRLRLWVDTNHDGVSQPGELMPLAAAGVVSIELTYRTTGRRDGHGNFYRYRGVVHLTSGRRVPIWDVFLATGPGVGSAPEEAEGTMPFDDETGSVVSRLEAAGPALAGDGDSVATPGPAAPDPPPTPLQVVEYYHLDALGSVRAVTNAQGQVIARHDFLPFGEELNPQYPPHDRRLFTGQERDFETGLDYFHARQLRVDLGRFATLDPLTDLAWTDPTLGATNAYGYVANNPLRYVDPDGRDAIFVNFSQGAAISGHRFGHNGIAVVFPDGSVFFSDFGHTGDPGILADPKVTIQPLDTHIEFGINGAPTTDSLEALAHELEGFEVAPSNSVRLAYLTTTVSQTAALGIWMASSPDTWQNAWYSKFSLFGRNCANYAREGMARIGRGWPGSASGVAVPNLDWLMFRMFSDWSYTPTRAGVTTEWSWKLQSSTSK